MAASKQKRIIPDDVVGEIQRWFPPKSLARFQCVSKKWRSMLLEEISKRSSKEEKVLLISESSIQSIDFSEPEIEAVTLVEFPVEDNFYVGCVNGLVLYLDSENRALILFNPWTQTRQPIRIPHPNPNPLTPISCLYGFGYDKSNDNYVIVIMDRENHNGFTWSSKTQNWVPFYCSLDVDLVKHRFYCTGWCVNGSIYWKMRSGVLCFDLKTHNFHVIEHPPRSPRSQLSLFVLGDRLAAIEYICSGLCTHVWELDGQMQWIKIMTIPKFILSPDDAVHYQSFLTVGHVVIHPLMAPVSVDNAIIRVLMAPVSRLKNGDLILVSKIFGSNRGWSLMREEGPARGKLYLYNEETKTFTSLKTEGMRGIGFSNRMISYKSNLFSPVWKTSTS